MILLARLCPENHGAKFTEKPLLRIVDLLVSLHLMFPGESLLANVALEDLFSFRFSHSEVRL